MSFHSRPLPPPARLPLVLAFAVALGASVPAGRADGAAGRTGVSAAPVQYRYEGNVFVEAHYRRPHEIRSYHSEAVYSADGRGRSRLDWTTWSGRDSARIPETYLVLGDSAFHRDAPGGKWELLSGDRLRLARLQVAAGIPSELGPLALSHTRSGAGNLMFDEGKFVFTTRHAHPRLGDVVDSVIYDYAGKEKLPRGALVVVHERDHQWRLVERRLGFPRSDFPESLLQKPSAFEPAAEDTLAGEPKIVPVAPGLWAVEMEDIDSRSMIVEFADHLAVIEFAVGSANGERIADAARRRWPQKPIRYALFSHHHPHYLGGVRAMIAEGATVVTTPGNEAYVREISTYLFESEPDRLMRTPRALKIRTFADRFELADSTNRLVAINYGERSQHTDEFVVFWFPRARVLFEAELGWARAGDGKLRAGRRAAALLAWIREQKLDVDRIVQSWPMRGNEASQTLAQLDTLVRDAKR